MVWQDAAAGQPPVFVPTPHGWVPAPAGYQPPLGWLPTAQGWQPAPPGWTPPPDWEHTPSGWLPPRPAPAVQAPAVPAPPGYAPPWYAPPNRPNAATRGFGWPRVLAPAEDVAARRRDRKPPGIEILIVLLVFPAGAVISALASLAQNATHTKQSGGYVDVIVPSHPALTAALNAFAVLTEFAPAALALYLLMLSGGGRRAIGLDLRRARTDVARCGKVLFLAYVGPLLIVANLLSFGSDKNPATDDLPKNLVYLIPLVLAAVSAGVVEEIVVLGYLVHRLEQRGWSTRNIIIVGTLVRVSYHLYYGLSAIGFAGWGALSVLLYLRRRRLLTFIALHIAWDTMGFVGLFLHGGYQALPELVLLLALLTTWLVGRRGVVAEERLSRQLLDRDPGVASLPPT